MVYKLLIIQKIYMQGRTASILNFRPNTPHLFKKKKKKPGI